jgi:hypothetical protein
MMASKVEQHFDAICELVASGVTIRDALASRPEFPAHPTFKCYAYHVDHPNRRKQLAAAQENAKLTRSKAYRPTRHTEAQYDRCLKIISESDPSVPVRDLDYEDGPGYTGLFARGKLDPEFQKRFDAAKSASGRVWGGRQATYSDNDYDRAVALIKQIGLVRYNSLREEVGLPHHCMLHRRSHADHAYGRRYRSVTAIMHREAASENHKSSLLADSLYGRVNKSVSRVIDPDARQDIVSDIVTAVLSGVITEEEIESRCVEYVASHNRRFNRFKCASMDAPIYDHSSFNLLDRLTTDPAESWGY